MGRNGDERIHELEDHDQQHQPTPGTGGGSQRRRGDGCHRDDGELDL